MNKLSTLIIVSIACLPLGILQEANALPDDADQPINIRASSNEILFDQGIAIYYGESGQLAEMSQGSLVIRGLEITIERVDGVLRKVTATGSPAQFQQQPALDQAIIYASGQTLIFDNLDRLVTVEGNAELTQDGNIINSEIITYDIDARRANASGGRNEQLRMVIPPGSITQ